VRLWYPNDLFGSELRLEAVGSLALRTGHHARIGDDHIEGFALREQFVRRLAHAAERGEVGFDEFNRRASRKRCRQRTLRLLKIARGADLRSPMRDDCASRFNTEANKLVPLLKSGGRYAPNRVVKYGIAS
jgi:hypothetical protein